MFTAKGRNCASLRQGVGVDYVNIIRRLEGAWFGWSTINSLVVSMRSADRVQDVVRVTSISCNKIRICGSENLEE